MSVALAPAPPAAPGDFDRLAEEMRKLTTATKIMAWMFDDPRFRIASRFFRRFWPIANLGKFWLISRYDDVQEVLGRDADFPVPFGPKFELMDRTGTNFMLGMPDDKTYRAIHRAVMQIFRLEDIPSIAAYAAERAEAHVAAGDGVIDAMAGLLTRVPAEIVGSYYGVPADDPDFPLWLFAMNYDSFPHLAVEPAVEPAALAGAAHVGPLLDAAIARAKAGPPDDSTILGRFVAAQKTNPVLTDDVIRATLAGFILGFIPTNNRASGQILQCLLRHPQWMEAAEQAALSGDDDLLGRVLFEALRFMPINPGPFRLVAEDAVIAATRPQATRVPKGALLMVSTQSASYDPRRAPDPESFDAYRSLADTLRFGWGQHWCIGFRIAVVQIAQTFKPLLLRGDIRRAAGRLGQPGYFGLFFEHLHVTYRADRR